MENVVVRTWSYDNNPLFLLDFSPGSHTQRPKHFTDKKSNLLMLLLLLLAAHFWQDSVLFFSPLSSHVRGIKMVDFFLSLFSPVLPVPWSQHRSQWQ